MPHTFIDTLFNKYEGNKNTHTLTHLLLTNLERATQAQVWEELEGVRVGNFSELTLQENDTPVTAVTAMFVSVLAG